MLVGVGEFGVKVVFKKSAVEKRDFAAKMRREVALVLAVKALEKERTEVVKVEIFSAFLRLCKEV